MVRLKAMELLSAKGKSRYWLNKRLGMSERNLNNMLMNKTASIRYEVLEKLCEALECEPNDLFEFMEDAKPIKEG